MRNRSLSFAVLSASAVLLLASCGAPARTPTPNAKSTAPLSGTPVALTLHAPATKSGIVARGTGLHTLGLPGGSAQDVHYNVRVRDGQQRPVTFQGGQYDPTGNGNPVLLLNSANNFAATLMLPEGSYTFETAVKSGIYDTSSSVLLAYGPSEENQFDVRDAGNNLHLAFHGVYDPAASSLDFNTYTPMLFTQSPVNLGLFAKSHAVAGVNYAIPAADLTMAATPYTIAQAESGRLNGAGSALGASITALGTPTVSDLTITAHFSAWVQTSPDEATFAPQTLTFTRPIQMNSVIADGEAPHNVTVIAPQSASKNSATFVTGTAEDNVGVKTIRLYDNQTLVASTLPSEIQGDVERITSYADGTWFTPWTPTTTGDHELTVMAVDGNGNDARSTTVVTTDDSLSMTPDDGGMDLTLQPGESTWVKFNSTATALALAGELHAWHNNAAISMTLSDTKGGSVIQPWTTGSDNGTVDSSYEPAPMYWAQYTNTSSTAQTVHVNYHFHFISID